jgi:hypothetical protein
LGLPPAQVRCARPMVAAMAASVLPSEDMKTVLAALAPVERYPGEVRGFGTIISNNAPAFRQAAESLPTPAPTTGWAR